MEEGRWKREPLNPYPLTLKMEEGRGKMEEGTLEPLPLEPLTLKLFNP